MAVEPAPPIGENAVIADLLAELPHDAVLSPGLVSYLENTAAGLTGAVESEQDIEEIREALAMSQALDARPVPLKNVEPPPPAPVKAAEGPVEIRALVAEVQELVQYLKDSRPEKKTRVLDEARLKGHVVPTLSEADPSLPEQHAPVLKALEKIWDRRVAIVTGPRAYDAAQGELADLFWQERALLGNSVLTNTELPLELVEQRLKAWAEKKQATLQKLAPELQRNTLARRLDTLGPLRDGLVAGDFKPLGTVPPARGKMPTLAEALKGVEAEAGPELPITQPRPLSPPPLSEGARRAADELAVHKRGLAAEKRNIVMVDGVPIDVDAIKSVLADEPLRQAMVELGRQMDLRNNLADGESGSYGGLAFGPYLEDWNAIAPLNFEGENFMSPPHSERPQESLTGFQLAERDRELREAKENTAPVAAEAEDVPSQETPRVKLRNGMEEDARLVATIMVILKDLWHRQNAAGLPDLNGMLLVCDLHEIASNGKRPVSKDTIKKLQELGLLQENGEPYSHVKNIVLSAARGEGIHMTLDSPLAEDQPIEPLRDAGSELADLLRAMAKARKDKVSAQAAPADAAQPERKSLIRETPLSLADAREAAPATSGRAELDMPDYPGFLGEEAVFYRFPEGAAARQTGRAALRQDGEAATLAVAAVSGGTAEDVVEESAEVSKVVADAGHGEETAIELENAGLRPDPAAGNGVTPPARPRKRALVDRRGSFTLRERKPPHDRQLG